MRELQDTLEDLKKIEDERVAKEKQQELEKQQAKKEIEEAKAAFKRVQQKLDYIMECDRVDQVLLDEREKEIERLERQNEQTLSTLKQLAEAPPPSPPKSKLPLILSLFLLLSVCGAAYMVHYIDTQQKDHQTLRTKAAVVTSNYFRTKAELESSQELQRTTALQYKACRKGYMTLRIVFTTMVKDLDKALKLAKNCEKTKKKTRELTKKKKERHSRIIKICNTNDPLGCMNKKHSIGVLEWNPPRSRSQQAKSSSRGHSLP